MHRPYFENRLTTMMSGSQVTQFVYDGDPAALRELCENRVKKIDPKGQLTPSRWGHTAHYG